MGWLLSPPSGRFLYVRRLPVPPFAVADVIPVASDDGGGEVGVSVSCIVGTVTFSELSQVEAYLSSITVSVQ